MTEESELRLPEITPNTANTLPSPRAGRWSAVLGALLYLAFFSGMTIFNNLHSALPPIAWVVLAPLTTVAYIVILVNTIRLLCRLSLTVRQEALLMLLALLLFLGSNPATYNIVSRLWHHEPWEVIFTSTVTPDSVPILGVFVPFLLILTGVFGGQLLSRIIRERAMLVPVSFIAALVDFWGVYWGPVGAATEKAGAAVTAMATAATAAATVPDEVLAAMPKEMQVFSSVSPPGSIGIGDFVFLAFFLTCAYRLGFSARRTMWGIFFGLLVTSMLYALNGQRIFDFPIQFSYLPGLIFICGGAFLANLRDWRLSRQEWRMTAVVVLLLVLLLVVGLVSGFVINRMNEPHIFPPSEYRLSARSVDRVISGTLAKIKKEHPDDSDVIPLYAGFRYDGTLKLCQWSLLVLVRDRPISLRNSSDEEIDGVLAQKPFDGWNVIHFRSSPPDKAFALLARQNEGDELNQVRYARGISKDRFAQLKHLDTFAQLAGKGNGFIIQIFPETTKVANEKGKVLKILPTPVRPYHP